jgi:spore germination protein GerM
VTVEDWSLENGLLTLTLSPALLNSDSMEQTITAFCAALTLCQVEGVEAVTVTAGGQTLFSGLAAADALLKDTDNDPYVRQLRLYFADSEGRYLVSEYHSLTLDEDTSPERYVVEELLRGPNNGELQGVLPQGTTLLSCTTADGVCTVDLSQEFYDNRPDTALGERLAIYSLVDSLTALSDVDSVVILVEGQSLDTYVYRSLAQPLTWYGEAVGPVYTAKGELDADLYLVLPGEQAIAALPFRIEMTDYESQTEAVLSALLTCAEPGYPALFSGSASVTDVMLQGTLCTIDLSESFFASLPAQARQAAIASIAATLCDLPGITSVRFTMGGSQVVLDGVDWSGPWSNFDEIKENN